MTCGHAALRQLLHAGGRPTVSYWGKARPPRLSPLPKDKTGSGNPLRILIGNRLIFSRLKH